MLKIVLSVVFLIVFVSSSGCVFRHSVDYGLVHSEPVIPARISVLPCRAWPTSFAIFGVEKGNHSKIPSDICQQFDKHVLSAFKNQPYMRGFTPRLLRSIHTKNGFDRNAFWDSFLSAQPHCVVCSDVASFYQNTHLQHTAWLSKLSEFSQNTRSSDAVLVPFVVSAKEFVRNERGIVIAGRGLRVALLLISTQTGKVIWFGGKKVLKQNQSILQVSDAKQKQFPPWELVFKDTLVSELWQDFPGRLY